MALGTTVGTGAVDGDRFRFAMSCSRPLSSLSLSLPPSVEQVVSRGNAHPIAKKPSINKETQMVGYPRGSWHRCNLL